MKILAVIPARAGSKGIPNKNIRLINNHPLVYYTINNAKKSKYITDIIVSTDSTEIETIARQMHVSVKKRSEKLCGDSVTLDTVIYDAAKDFDADYIISMQPTSPTLTVSTLDSAIEYALIHKTDTLISVINNPHLAWIEEGGIKKPAYKERLNRQYLPPYYLETGAFFISRKNVVTPSSRFGGRCDVFEIPETEAIDIDTFEDLKYAEAILNKQTVAIYVNGNTQRGMGHIYRALELADEFYSKPDIYFDSNQTDIHIFGNTTHNLIPVDGIGELLNAISQKQYNIFINDILSTSIDYMIALRKNLPNAKIINFEDDGEGIYKADLVINALFQESCLPNMVSGEKYYISSKLYMFYEPIIIKENIKKVFISFGGADPQNYSERLLSIITKEKYKNIQFVVVLGRAKENVKKLLDYNSYENIEVLYDIQNMPEIMSQCDIGITSRGRTGYELAMLGIPSIAMAQNHREEKHGFVCNDNGFSYLGLNPADQTIEATLDMFINMDKDERLRYQKLLLNHDLRNGRKRVMNLINNL
ncbi:MAG: cytidylyltransferase domain-containing protein [Lachnospiraceae bacterium]